MSPSHHGRLFGRARPLGGEVPAAGFGDDDGVLVADAQLALGITCAPAPSGARAPGRPSGLESPRGCRRPSSPAARGRAAPGCAARRRRPAAGGSRTRGAACGVRSGPGCRPSSTSSPCPAPADGRRGGGAQAVQPWTRRASRSSVFSSRGSSISHLQLRTLAPEQHMSHASRVNGLLEKLKARTALGGFLLWLVPPFNRREVRGLEGMSSGGLRCAPSGPEASVSVWRDFICRSQHLAQPQR